MSGERKTRVFVSYARADAAVVMPLAERLRGAGLEVLVDTEAIAKAEEWQPRLAKLIAAADAVAFFLSTASARSSVCGWEVETAEQLAKRIVPVVIERLPDHQVPRGLQRRNYVFADEPGAQQQAAAQIVEAALTDIGWVREHTRLTELSTRWQGLHQPADLLLRGEELRTAEAWLGMAPAAAPLPSTLQRTFIALSAKAAKRRRRWTAGAAAGVLLLAVGAGALLHWQRQINLAERAAEVARAEQAITEEVLRTAEKLDARLGYIRTATAASSLSRDGAAAGLPKGVIAGADRILAEQRIAALRQRLNGAPLNLDLRADISRRAAATKADPVLIGQLYDGLAGVADRTEDLLTTLAAAAGEACREPQAERYHAERMALAVRTVQHESNMALRHGLAVLWSLGTAPATVDGRLAALQHLVPRSLPREGAAFGALLERDLQAQAAILAERGRLLDASKAVTDVCLAKSLAALNDDLALKPEDGPRELIVKGRALRKLGEMARAEQMLEALGERFPDAFPGMSAYLAAARAFARDIVLAAEQDGGVYIDTVAPDSPAAAAGIEPGDIVLSYGGKPVSWTEDLQAAIAAAPAGATIEVVLARKSPDGRYQRRTLRLPAAPRLGVGMRPI